MQVIAFLEQNIRGFMSQKAGRIFGAVAGFFLGGGPLGAILGYFAGSWFDRNMVLEDNNKRYYNPNTVFWTGLSALAAKLSKADGVVSPKEIEIFNAFLIRNNVDIQTRKLCAEVFNKAKTDSLGYEAYAQDIYQIWYYQRNVLTEIFVVLLQIAHADDILHPKEKEILNAIAIEFGFTTYEYQRLMAYFQTDDPDQIYKILGVERNSSISEIKKAYRKLVKEHHPDKLMSQGVPEHVVEEAKNRMAKINDAYDKIIKQRGAN